jgi:hypothetical protein
MDSLGISKAIKRVTQFTLIGSSFAFLATAAACGSSSSPPPSSSEQQDTTAEVGALPCNLTTQFGNRGGDTQCIQPPAADQGFQFHYGPTNYNDPVEVAKYTLQPGGEVTDCVYVKTPNDTDVYFNTYHARMRPGSHHMLLYIQNTQMPDTGTNGPSDCNQGPDSRNLFGAQTQNLDVVGNADGAPENNGIAVKIPAHQQAVMQLHFINAGTQPILREAWANLLYTPESEVTQLADPIFFLAGVGMDVKKGQSVVISGTAKVPATAGPDFRLMSATPHYHTHTTRFTVWATISGQKQVILDNFPTMHVLPEPQLTYFDSVAKNAPPNESARLDGASSGILRMKPGDQIDWECDITNDDIPQGITFQNAVYTGEMCNLFGIYGPTTGAAWSATNL